MSWVLSTGCDSLYEPIAAITWPTHLAYARRWDMAYVPRRWPDNQGVYASWNRLNDINDAIRAGAEGVVCVDTDAVFLTTEQPFVLSDSVALGFQMLKGEVFPSCGLMVIKNDDKGRRWLRELQLGKLDYRDDPWCEQAVAYDLLGFDSKHKIPGPGRQWGHLRWEVQMLDRRWHSTPQDPVEGAWLFHATGGVGVGVEARVARLREAVTPPDRLVDAQATDSQGETT